MGALFALLAIIVYSCHVARFELGPVPRTTSTLAASVSSAEQIWLWSGPFAFVCGAFKGRYFHRVVLLGKLIDLRVGVRLVGA